MLVPNDFVKHSRIFNNNDLLNLIKITLGSGGGGGVSSMKSQDEGCL